MNYAVTELNNTTFNLYSVLLAISGILLAVTTATGFGTRSVPVRVLNGICAVAFLAYAIYLQFIFTSGTVFISYYVFLVPIVLVIQAFRNRAMAKQAAVGQAIAKAAGYPNPQPGYPSAQPSATPAQPGFGPAQPSATPAQPGSPAAPYTDATIAPAPAQPNGPAQQPEPTA